MRGSSTGMAMIFVLITIFALSAVAGIFGKVITNYLHSSYVIYDYYATHYLAGKKRPLAVLTPKELKNFEFEGKSYAFVILYNLKDKKIESLYKGGTFENIGNAIYKETCENLANKTPKEPFIEEKSPVYSAFALPVIIDKSGEKSPGLLIIANDNFASVSENIKDCINQILEEIKEKLKEGE